jgi:hypothetical protein
MFGVYLTAIFTCNVTVWTFPDWKGEDERIEEKKSEEKDENKFLHFLLSFSTVGKRVKDSPIWFLLRRLYLQFLVLLFRYWWFHSLSVLTIWFSLSISVPRFIYSFVCSTIFSRFCLLFRCKKAHEHVAMQEMIAILNVTYPKEVTMLTDLCF